MQSLVAINAAASVGCGIAGKLSAIRAIADGAGSQMPLTLSKGGCWSRMARSRRSPMMPAPMRPIESAGSDIVVILVRSGQGVR
jgi:hypothetical protein